MSVVLLTVLTVLLKGCFEIVPGPCTDIADKRGWAEVIGASIASS
ncbi:MAG: hypothetical protein OFPI_17830 [Osedax symbiont Rs2]|nr:MAG: hypothetical protein OFPI_17830 [Osedax symbiont Rs2]